MMKSKTLRGQTLFSIGALAGMAAVRVFRGAHYELRGKTVFISGGSRGLGLLLAHEFASRGAKISISGRDRDASDRAADDLRSSGAQVLALETDIGMREEAELAVDQIRRKLGAIDVLVNNAGTICGPDGGYDHR